MFWTVTLSLVFCLLASIADAAAPALQFIAPRGGEFYVAGQTQQVLLSSKLKTVTLELSRDGGLAFLPLGIIDNTVKDASKRNVFSFVILGPASSNCVIRASGTAGKTNVSVVTGAFTIQFPTAGDVAGTLVQRDDSGNFAANTITANLTGNVSGSAASFTGELAGDVTGPMGATVISNLQGIPVFAGMPGAGQVLTLNGLSNRWEAANLPPAPPSVLGLVFGDGHDGIGFFNGDDTLTRDMYFDTLTVKPGATLHTGGFRIFVRNGCDINGVIDNSGGNGGDATIETGVAGGAGAMGSLGGGTAGGAYLNHFPYSSAGLTDAMGGQGGNGGHLIFPPPPYGMAGAATPVPDAAGGSSVACCFVNAVSGRDLNGGVLTGGTGGGAGSGDGVVFGGGGGGGGGGVVVLVAQTITGTGSVQAKGGNGGNGFPAGAGGADGGGGGGGLIILLSTAAPAASLNLDVSGGTPGLPGAFVPGTAGAAGRVVVLH